jgi:transcriptional regulator with XRE-family HTH domain
VATETGVSASTLSRLENGETPDLETFLDLSSWVGLSTSAFLHEDRERDTVQLVEQVLREDGILVSETLDAFVILLHAVHGRIRKEEGA